MYKCTLLHTCRSVAGRQLVLAWFQQLPNQYELQVDNNFKTALCGKV